MPAIVIFLFFLCVEYLLYHLLSDTSHFALFKYCNLYAMITTSSWLALPVFLPLDSIGVSYTSFCFLAWSISFLLLIPCLIHVYLHPFHKQLHFPFSTQWIQKRVYHTHSHFLHEGLKLYWMNKGILVLLMVLGYAFVYADNIQHVLTPSFQSQQTALLQEYETYGGNMNKEKWNTLDQEYQRIQKMKENYHNVRAQYLNQQMEQSAYEAKTMQYHSELSHITAFETLYEQAIPGSKELIYAKGYQAISSIHTDQREIRNAFVLTAALILILSGIYTIDQRKQEDILYQLTRKGTASRRRKKMMLTMLTAFLLVLIVYGIEFLSFLKVYPMRDWSAPFSSILTESLSLPYPLQSSISLFHYGMILFLLRLLGAMISGILILYLSRQFQSKLTVILLSSLFLLFPILLAANGVHEIYLFSLFDILSGNLFLQQETSFLKLFAYLLLSAVLWKISGSKSGKRQHS